MTEEDRMLLVNFKSSTQQLFETFNKLESEKKLLGEDIVSLKHEIEILKQEKLEIGRKNEQLKVATQFLSKNNENGEAKQKIDFLVREIDKCIALLNR